MKGRNKCRNTRFKNGHIPYNKGWHILTSLTEETPVRSIRRLTTDETLPTYSINSTHIQFGVAETMVLRQIERKKNERDLEQIDDTKGSRIIDSEKMTEMMSSVSVQHSTTAKGCPEASFKTNKTIKWGTGWKYSFFCSNCDFKSETFKLYKEIKTNLPGPNAAATNVGLQAGLLDTPIGNTRMRMLLASMDIPPPHRSAMNKTANKVSRQVINTNTVDMQSKMEHLTDTLRDLGCSADIHGAFDGRYNSVAIVSHTKPGQNSSQAIGVFAETMTDCHWIIDYCVENKLCPIGSHLRSRGHDISCPGDHHGCTATLSSVAPHSEYEMAKKICTSLQEKGVRVKVLTTDGDSRAQNAFEDTYKTMFPGFQLLKQRDTTHIGRSQVRKGLNSNFSDKMFPGCRTKASYKQAKVIFSLDVKARCSLIYNKLYDRSGGNLHKLSPSIISRAVESTIRCYSGDCSSCRRHAISCGGGQKSSWWERSAFLGPNKITALQLTENDKVLLREIINMRLSAEAVADTRFGYHTQQCESFNFSLSMSAPKNINFPRNFEARCASAILRFNNGQGAALKLKLLELGIKLSPSTERALNKLGSDMRAHRRLDKARLKHRILKRRGDMLYQYKVYKTRPEARVSDYKSKPCDHNYSCT